MEDGSPECRIRPHSIDKRTLAQYGFHVCIHCQTENCSIVDLYDRSVVSSVNGKRMDAYLAVDTLKKALENNPSASGKVILHSDQGSQFTSQTFTEYCEEQKVTQSMSRAGVSI